jgi:hypothetical protein
MNEPNLSGYVHLLVSVIHPVFEVTTNRYCVGISLQDSRMRKFDLDSWAKPEMRRLILSLLCEEWLTDGCTIVGCEQIAGAVQWKAVH